MCRGLDESPGVAAATRFFFPFFLGCAALPCPLDDLADALGAAGVAAFDVVSCAKTGPATMAHASPRAVR